MKQIKNLLNKQYPISSKNEESFRVVIYTGLFIGAFLFFFQPFGLDKIGVSKLFLLGYGVVTMLVLVFNLILLKNIFRSLFQEENWTIWKNIVWLLWILFTIGVGNFIYSSLIFGGISVNLKNLLFFELYTLVIGFFPITLITLFTQNRYLKKHINGALQITDQIQAAKKISTHSNKIHFLSENKKESLTLNIQDLLFIEASGNYVEINYTENDKIFTKLLRTSLKKVLENTSEYPHIFKSHRSFAINIHRISVVEGNAQGYQVQLNGTDKTVPVSRSYIPDFKKKFNWKN